MAAGSVEAAEGAGHRGARASRGRADEEGGTAGEEAVRRCAAVRPTDRARAGG